MTLGLINANPVVRERKERIIRTTTHHHEQVVDPLDIYDILLYFQLVIYIFFYIILITSIIYVCEL